MAGKPILVRGIDRQNDYRIICPNCKRDMGGTFAAIPQHKIRHVICERCRWGSYENFLADWKAKIEAGKSNVDVG